MSEKRSQASTNCPPKRCTESLICPVCGVQLAQMDNTLKCPQAHSFDIAREGYVNLLLSGRKRPKILGDTRDMLRARRDFLAQGFYDPLSDAINERVYDYLQKLGDAPSPTCIADVGCGEGYYLGRLKRHLDHQLAHGDVRYFGIDISKQAAKLAAKRYKEICFVVADVNQKLLFLDHTVHVLTNIFAPRNTAEFDRVVTHDGLVLVVIPGPRHLASLSELNILSLGIEPDKQKHVIEQLTGVFTQTGEQIVTYKIHLDNKSLVNLIQMTPNYWHSSSETWDHVETIENVQTEVSFIVLEFNR